MHVNLRKLGLGFASVVVATTLFFAFANGGESRARYDDARTDLDADCTRWRRAGGSAWVCDVSAHGSSLVPTLKKGEARLTSASLALARRDDATAERELAGALDIVTDLDRLGGSVAAVMAASLLQQTLAVIEAEVPNGPSGQEMKARLLAERRLQSVAHPLRAQRLTATRAILDAFDRPFVRGVGLQMVAEEEEVTAAMERAITLGDVEGCIRADQRRSWLSARYAGLSFPKLCSRLVEVAQTGKRLDHARKSALRHSSKRASLR